jgi:predicted nucleic acid-binding protein
VTEHWAIDASPLILLGKTNQLDWLTGLGKIVIPNSVALEISAGSSTDPARQWLSSKSTRNMIKEDIDASRELLGWDLGAGETSVIAWCQLHREYEAVVDDATGRRCAGVFGVKLRGTLAILALAKKRGLIPLCRPIFEKFETEGFFIAPDLVEKVAQSVGE